MTTPAETTGPSDPTERQEMGRLLLIGARRRLGQLASYLDQTPLARWHVVGYVDRSGRGRQLAVDPGSDPVPVLGRLDRLAELVQRSRATDLVVALSERPAQRLDAQLARLQNGRKIRVHWVSNDAERPIDIPHRRLRPARRRRPLHAGRLAKRLLDIIGAIAGLLILSPVLTALTLLIYMTSGRPIFYSQERVGQGGRIFRIWKFRSMRPDAEQGTGPIWASNHDDRCTPIGDWLRHSSLDELPQLFNILKGDMSFVGPRPERPIFVDQFVAEIPEYTLRHTVPVGLTGWAQVHGWRGRTSLRKRLQYDLDYIRRWSFWLDVKILFMTVLHVSIGKCDWGDTRYRRIERELADALGRDTHPQRPAPPGDLPGQPESPTAEGP